MHPLEAPGTLCGDTPTFQGPLLQPCCQRLPPPTLSSGSVITGVLETRTPLPSSSEDLVAVGGHWAANSGQPLCPQTLIPMTSVQVMVPLRRLSHKLPRAQWLKTTFIHSPPVWRPDACHRGAGTCHTPSEARGGTLPADSSFWWLQVVLGWWPRPSDLCRISTRSHPCVSACPPYLTRILSLDVGPPSVRVTSSQIPYLPHTRETLPPDEVAFPGTGARGRASHLGAAIQPTTPQKGNCWRRWALARGHLLGGWMLSSLRIFFSLLSFFQGLQHKREKCSFDVVIRIQTLNVSLSG